MRGFVVHSATANTPESSPGWLQDGCVEKLVEALPCQIRSSGVRAQGPCKTLVPIACSSRSKRILLVPFTLLTPAHSSLSIQLITMKLSPVKSLLSGFALAILSSPILAQVNSTITSVSTATASTNNSALEYSITALPAVINQTSCVFNCLIPIGLADPSGCDDITNDCACLSAPVDVMDALTSCIQTVCKSSTSQFADSATSLYSSYCVSVYGADPISSAISANSVSDASAAASATDSTTPSATTPAIASSTAKSEALGSVPSM
jgi:hypothetical protein